MAKLKTDRVLILPLFMPAHEHPAPSSHPGARPPLVAIVGPTAVGKTALALGLARHIPVEIVSVDSRQVYRGMDVGTAKPTQDERARVPHHLVDVVEPTEEFGLATYLELARAAIGDIHQRGRLPLLVGGTGQYLWALLEAWSVPRVPPDPAYRREMEAFGTAHGPEALHARLMDLDPKAAATIDPRNQRRVIRALEVIHQTAVPFSEVRRRGPQRYRSLILGLTLPRAELYRRIDQRADHMLGAGWLEEVRRLLRGGASRLHPAMASVGYGELAAHLSGELSWAEAVRHTKSRSHRVARHQYAWFRLADPRIHWLEAGPGAAQQATHLVTDFLVATGWAYATMGFPTK
ncbi:MAG: tRNA (adenosine(37)-N6)-dimethylallyltransferase MiaA [Chloroflexi bacterium]|nr:tRNA (adenosine(37)-N6)-dimethylallyltransferase MiaA [Chloroflexota bacterium]